MMKEERHYPPRVILNLPSRWKHSVVIAIRTSYIFKAMENMFNTRTQWFLDKKNAISEIQMPCLLNGVLVGLKRKYRCQYILLSILIGV